MKIILSRKGFDSSSGGAPSPIFPDGKLLSLPIPDKTSTLAYGDITGNNWATVGELVHQLAGLPSTHRAHLDPDLRFQSIRRTKGWRPIFGQTGSAESHLRNQNVGEGDIFLFFGLFRPVERPNSKWQYVRGSRPIHALFGWLQIASPIVVSAWPTTEKWAHYHPHFDRESDPRNVIYDSSERLALPDFSSGYFAGAGVFETISPRLILTGIDSKRPGRWLLPEWFHPETRPSALSYHRDQARWERGENGVILSSVSRGQEFVLDCHAYPEALEWVRSLFVCGTS